MEGNEVDPVFDHSEYAAAPSGKPRFRAGKGWVSEANPNPTLKDRAYERRLEKRRKAKRAARAAKRRNTKCR